MSQYCPEGQVPLQVGAEALVQGWPEEEDDELPEEEDDELLEEELLLEEVVEDMQEQVLKLPL